MARLNELLGIGSRYSRGLATLLGLDEQEGITTAAPEIVPIIDLDARLENWVLGGGSLLWGLQGGLAAGGAGFRSQIAIDNPAGSGVITIVERVRMNGGVAETLNMASSEVQLTGSTGNLVQRDFRRATTSGLSGGFSSRIRTQNNAALTGLASTVGSFGMSAAGVVEMDLSCVLRPGSSLRFFAGADNAAIVNNLMFWVRERPVAPRELVPL